MTRNPDDSLAPRALEEDWIELVRQRVARLRYGSVQITIHDGKVTQIESIEKTRFTPPKDPSRPATG